MRIFILTLIIFLSSLGLVDANANPPTVTVPAEIISEMEAAGMGAWHEIEAKPGARVSLPRPMLCEGCGGTFYPDIVNQDHLSCPTCPSPVTETTRRFVTPKSVLPNQNLRIFLPNAMSAGAQPQTPVARALNARIAEFASLEMIACGSCGRQNNPNIFSNCYSCGDLVDRDQVRPAATQRTTVLPSEPAPQSPETPPARRTSLRGTVSTPALNTARVSPTSQVARITSRFHIPRGVVIGSGATILTFGAAIGIGYMITGDDVHVSRGTVEVVNSERVIINVPGFNEPIILTYDPNAEFDSSIYEKDTLEPYIAVDTVEVWWTRDDGVIQIIPLDFDLDTLGAQHD